ncbi:MAG: type VI secretion system protein ImpL [Methyloprofundus sp.]|nr:MAG: type VI secretion system protein ImpL [Methyloprofundus sp.]
MKTIFNFFKQRWVITLLGMIALSMLIWFIGPLFAFAGSAPLEAENHRWYLIGFSFSIWAIVQVWSLFKARRQNNQILGAMAGADEPSLSADEQASQDEQDTLSQDMQTALGVLKDSRLGSGSKKQFLYQLPWYVIIGPPGAGKTTLLKNSNLKFPLSDHFGKDAVRGVGGTRNCDWWFAEDAVLLDTAGRYTTQDSHEPVDQAAWISFLELLKKNRSRRPINGVIIAVSISDLLQQNKEQCLAQARAIRTRIEELHEQFNIRFPIYLLFTKCDLLSGFMEYFDDLDKEQGAQVWGMTFKLGEEEKQNIVSQFGIEFELLQQQLQKQLINKLERERGAERRNLIYTFPQQFGALSELITPFLEELFQDSRYTHDAMFRGVYFTSATQEGSPIDRIMGSLSSSFGLSRQAGIANTGQGKSYFINSLLRKLIFAESGLAGANLNLEKKQRWFQKGAFIGIAALTGIISFAWVTSYFSNEAYIKEVSAQAVAIEKKVNEINPEETDPLVLLAILDKIRALPGGYAAQLEGTPWSLTFGLYQGDKLGSAEVMLYRRLLEESYLPRMMHRLERQLQTNTDNSDYLYEALKVYLMLASSEHYDAGAIAAWFKLYWKYNLPIEISTEQRASLSLHLDTLLAVRPAPLPRPLDKVLVEQTRQILQDTPVAQRVYAHLKLELNKNKLADYRVSEKAGRDAVLVLSRKNGESLAGGVPALFTCAGYKDLFLPNNESFIKQQAVNNWVFGQDKEQAVAFSDAEVQALRTDLLTLYLDDYIQHWDNLLADIQIKPFATEAQIADALKIISGEQSPVKLFLESVAEETSLSCMNKEADDSLLAKAGEKIDAAGSMLDNIMRNTPETQAPSASTNRVIRHFAELNALVQKKDGLPAPLDRNLSTLNELYIHLNSLAGMGEGSLKTDERKRVMQVAAKTKLDSSRSPLPVSGMMAKVGDAVINIVSGGAKKHINAMWRAEVLPFCRQAIQGLYPVGKKSREITFEDFTYFFGPKGLMDEFYNKYLAASVEKGRRNWRWNTRGKGKAGVSMGGLKQFQRAENIKNTFFRLGRQSPAISFKLKPISMSSSIVQFTMDIDGQVLTYAHGPVRPVAMKWPGPNNSGQVRIQMLPPKQGYSGISKDGPWAIFRIFDEADITRTSNPAIFIMTFKIQGREAKFELQASSAVNPFQLIDLKSFRCLSTL